MPGPRRVDRPFPLVPLLGRPATLGEPGGGVDLTVEVEHDTAEYLDGQAVSVQAPHQGATGDGGAVGIVQITRVGDEENTANT